MEPFTGAQVNEPVILDVLKGRVSLGHAYRLHERVLEFDDVRDALLGYGLDRLYEQVRTEE